MSLFESRGVCRRFGPILTFPLLLTGLAVGCNSGGLEGADDGGNPNDSSAHDDPGYPAGTTGAAGSGDEWGGGTDGDGSGGGEDWPPEKEEPEPKEPPKDTCNDVDDVTLYLSPDDSNSMSSPAQIREAALDDFGSVRSIPVRTWEFLNYYHFDYPAAPTGEVLVTPSLIGDPEVGEYTLQIAVSSETVAPADRRPMNVTLVLDTSGSMSGHPMEMLKQTSLAIAGSLEEGDTVSMVTWNTSNAIVLGGYEVDGPSDQVVVEAINSLDASGGTDLHGGLTAGYSLANDVHDSDRINRIVLISDGGANVGVTDIDLIADNAGGNNEDGIYMVGVGVGTATSYHDALMDAVTDAGKGASVFINDAAEAQKIFGDEFISTMDVAVRDVQVRLDLPPGFEAVQFSGEEISGDPSEVEPQHLAPNDHMVFHQEIETCAPELGGPDAEVVVTVQYLDGVTFEQRQTSINTTIGELLENDRSQLLKGAAIFEYAEALKGYQQAVGATEEQAALAPAFDALDLADIALPGDPDLAEIRVVLDAL